MTHARRHISLVVAALALVATTVAAAATSAPLADPGVTPTSVLVGGTVPLSGPSAGEAAVARGADAYFDWVNAHGGVNGRRIDYAYLDDAATPAQTQLATQRLVEQDRVFAIFNTVGTEQNRAVRDYLNAAKVPQLFAASSATTFGSDGARYPYTIGLRPSAYAEGWVYGRYVARTLGTARIGVLVDGDDAGKDLLAGLRKGLERSKVRVVSVQTVDASAADLSAPVAKVRTAAATVLALFTGPASTVRAYAAVGKVGWKPKLTLVDASAAAAGVMALAAEGANRAPAGSVTIGYVKDPGDPQWAKDKGMAQYRQILRQYAPGASPADAGHVYGMAAAWTLVEAIRRAGKDLTREGLMQAVSSLSLTGNPFLVPGIALRTGPGDRFPIEQMVLQRWTKATWRSFGGLWGYRAG